MASPKTLAVAGVTPAPAVGRFATTEILDGTTMAALAPCRIERFA